jgi:hypothetical protein
MKPLQVIAILLIALMLLLLGFCAGHGSRQAGTTSDTVYTSTVTRDTIATKDTVMIQSKPKVVYRKNSPPFQGGAGVVVIHDTIQVPGVQLAITDTLQGDSITSRLTEIIQQDTTFKETTKDTVWITEKAEKPKWKPFSVNVSAGYGYSIGSPVPAPQIGITVGLKLFSF